jgi:hypothetical protein
MFSVSGKNLVWSACEKVSASCFSFYFFFFGASFLQAELSYRAWSGNSSLFLFLSKGWLLDLVESAWIAMRLH